MAAKIPERAVMAKFRFEDGASNALALLKASSKIQGISIQNAATLKDDLNGKLRIKETADMGGGKGAVIGGAMGGIAGVLGSAVILPLGIGAAAGGLASKLRDSGFPNQWLREFGEGVQPGTSLVIVAVEESNADFVAVTLRNAGADEVGEIRDGKIVEGVELAAAAPVTPLQSATSATVTPLQPAAAAPVTQVEAPQTATAPEESSATSV